MRSVVRTVRRLAEDAAAVEALQRDPARFADRLELSDAARRGLSAADTFFQSEKPILQAPRAPAPQAATRRRARFAAHAAGERVTAASSDTGTLLPGPNTGSFEGATGTFTQTATPAPRPPQQPGPAPQPPATPQPPVSPQPPATPQPPVSPAPTTPQVPLQPSPFPPSPFPPLPPLPPQPPAYPQPALQPAPPRPPYPPEAPPPQWPPFVPSHPPTPPPTAWPPPTYAAGQGWPGAAQHPCAGSCGCEQAIVALSAMVATTSQTALAAITALASRGGR